MEYSIDIKTGRVGAITREYEYTVLDLTKDIYIPVGSKYIRITKEITEKLYIAEVYDTELVPIHHITYGIYHYTIDNVVLGLRYTKEEIKVGKIDVDYNN